MTAPAPTSPTPEVSSQLAYLSRALKMPTIARTWEDIAAQARDQGWSHEEYLAAVLQRQASDREASGSRMRIQTAHFPAIKTLEDFNVDHQPTLAAADGQIMVGHRLDVRPLQLAGALEGNHAHATGGRALVSLQHLYGHGQQPLQFAQQQHLAQAVHQGLLGVIAPAGDRQVAFGGGLTIDEQVNHAARCLLNQAAQVRRPGPDLQVGGVRELLKAAVAHGAVTSKLARALRPLSTSTTRSVQAPGASLRASGIWLVTVAPRTMRFWA